MVFFEFLLHCTFIVMIVEFSFINFPLFGNFDAKIEFFSLEKQKRENEGSHQGEFARKVFFAILFYVLAKQQRN